MLGSDSVPFEEHVWNIQLWSWFTPFYLLLIHFYSSVEVDVLACIYSYVLQGPDRPNFDIELLKILTSDIDPFQILTFDIGRFWNSDFDIGNVWNVDNDIKFLTLAF